MYGDPAQIDLAHEIRTISFENPDGARGSAGQAHDGRKGAPNRFLEPGEHLVLGDIEGPGRVRHLWMTFPPMTPEAMRGVWLEIFYDDAAEPSASVPCVDFFGLPHGRPVPYESALNAVQEGRGFNSWVPMPFRSRIRVELHNDSGRAFPFYYQISYTLGPADQGAGLLHVSFRRENPTRLKEDFTIAEGLRGPGRFLGCNVGVRVLPDDRFSWYGEGEVKIYLDGDGPFPTWCGTGLEDYVGTAWGMGAHSTRWQGVPLVLEATGETAMPDLVSFFRWHVPDPVVFRDDLRVTLQQIGAVPLKKDQEAVKEQLSEAGRVAGSGWLPLRTRYAEWFGICERQDDVCATAYVYCQEAQPVPRLDVAAACADIERRPAEVATPFEENLAPLTSERED